MVLSLRCLVLDFLIEDNASVLKNENDGFMSMDDKDDLADFPLQAAIVRRDIESVKTHIKGSNKFEIWEALPETKKAEETLVPVVYEILTPVVYAIIRLTEFEIYQAPLKIESILSYLLQNGGDPSTVDANQQNAFHWVCLQKKPAALTLLLNTNTNEEKNKLEPLNQISDFGQTPLDIVVRDILSLLHCQAKKNRKLSTKRSDDNFAYQRLPGGNEEKKEENLERLLKNIPKDRRQEFYNEKISPNLVYKGDDKKRFEKLVSLLSQLIVQGAKSSTQLRTMRNTEYSEYVQQQYCLFLKKFILYVAAKCESLNLQKEGICTDKQKNIFQVEIKLFNVCKAEAEKALIDKVTPAKNFTQDFKKAAFKNLPNLTLFSSEAVRQFDLEDLVPIGLLGGFSFFQSSDGGVDSAEVMYLLEKGQTYVQTDEIKELQQQLSKLKKPHGTTEISAKNEEKANKNEDNALVGTARSTENYGTF